MGGLALVSDDLGQLKLPVHLYQELKRSREKPMPPLFRDQCYEYLNTILEQAR